MRNKFKKFHFDITRFSPLPVIEGVEIRHVGFLVGVAVGSDGEVWSCRNRGNGTQWKKLSRRSGNTDGYVASTFAMPYGQKCKSYKFAYLVCQAFHGPRQTPEMEVCHEDGDRRNDRADNLYWGTPQQNTDDRIRHGRKCGVPPDQTNTAKLTWDAVRMIRASGISHQCEIEMLAGQYGVHWSTIRHVVNGTTWKEAA